LRAADLVDGRNRQRRLGGDRRAVGGITPTQALPIEEGFL
jgi:hypothetical protein